MKHKIEEKYVHTLRRNVRTHLPVINAEPYGTIALES